MELSALHFVHGNALNDACIVHQNVNLPHLSVNFLYEGLHGILVSNVTDVAFHVLDASLLVVVKSALKGSFVNVVEDNVLNTGSHESLGNVKADAIGSACNPGILSF